MFRQGDIISYTENRNSSDSKGSVSFGIYLNMCRLKRKITLKKLCHGLCSVSYLAEIMHGKKRADWQLRNRLLERTGENGLDHEIYFGYEEAVEWERQRDILIALEDCKIIQAAEKLADYAEEYGIFAGSRSGVTSRLRRQFYYGMQGMSGVFGWNRNSEQIRSCRKPRKVRSCGKREQVGSRRKPGKVRSCGKREQVGSRRNPGQVGSCRKQEQIGSRGNPGQVRNGRKSGRTRKSETAGVPGGSASFRTWNRRLCLGRQSGLLFPGRTVTPFMEWRSQSRNLI